MHTHLLSLSHTHISHGTRMKESRCTYDWVMATSVSESCRICPLTHPHTLALSHVRMSYTWMTYGTHMNESRAHVWIRHGRRMNGSCQANQWVMAPMSHVARMSHFTHPHLLITTGARPHQSSPLSFAEHSLLYRALLQKRPVILRSLRIVVTWSHIHVSWRT